LFHEPSGRKFSESIHDLPSFVAIRLIGTYEPRGRSTSFASPTKA
jgi:hypothetical protein